MLYYFIFLLFYVCFDVNCFYCCCFLGGWKGVIKRKGLIDGLGSWI